LTKNGITSNGLAEGDLKLGKYVSLRNECFTYDWRKGHGIYPPDSFGWNAAKHEIPFKIPNGHNDKSWINYMYYGLSLIVLIVSLYFYFKFKM
jgi:hypothetical protein